MAEHGNRCWTNHHSLVQYKGEWYLFYHRNHYSPKMDKRRSACIEKVSFNADGTIQEVKQTLRGVGLTQATSKIEVDRYSSAGDGVSVDFNDSTNTFRGWHATLSNTGSWLRYNDVDFSSITAGYVSVKIKANANTNLTIREDSADGKPIAKLAINVETPQYDLMRIWTILTYALDEMPRGTTDLSIVCEGAEMSIDWMQFKSAPLP